MIHFSGVNVMFASLIKLNYFYYLNAVGLQAIPDTKLTIRKYADAKFEYLVSFPTKNYCTCSNRFGA